MTKEKIRYVIKRFRYIKVMIEKDIVETTIIVNNKKEVITVDKEIKAIVNAIDDIVYNTKSKWLKTVIIDIINGKKDISIFVNNPIERTKYYEIKKEFINKIYICCVYKGLVSYEDILKEEIG